MQKSFSDRVSVPYIFLHMDSCETCVPSPNGLYQGMAGNYVFVPDC